MYDTALADTFSRAPIRESPIMFIIDPKRQCISAALFAALLLPLPGCASQVLKGFVGRDVSSAIARYGPPETTFDLPDGRRAFQWKMVDSYIVPTETSAEDVDTANGRRETVKTTGGYWKDEVCYYTIYANAGPNGSWTISGYEKPTFDCE